MFLEKWSVRLVAVHVYSPASSARPVGHVANTCKNAPNNYWEIEVLSVSGQCPSVSGDHFKNRTFYFGLRYNIFMTKRKYS
jgi:hypothetical protein